MAGDLSIFTLERRNVWIFGAILILLCGCTSMESANNGPQSPSDSLGIEDFELKSINVMYACAVDESLATQRLDSTLVGRWQWKHQSCFWMPESASSTKHSRLHLTFTQGHELKVQDSGLMPSSSVWAIQERAGAAQLETTPWVGQTLGRVLVCKNSVVFSQSHLDGCDNWFHRVEY